MAVKYNELKQKLETEVLTSEETKYVDAAEKCIDDELTTKFDNRGVYIEMNILDFKCIPNYAVSISNIKDTRKAIMRKELERRFRAAGWNIKEELSDRGPDYVVFSGKK